jgi:hypothetical protein
MSLPNADNDPRSLSRILRLSASAALRTPWGKVATGRSVIVTILMHRVLGAAFVSDHDARSRSARSGGAFSLAHQPCAGHPSRDAVP